MKKYILLLVFVLVPSLLMAQAAGGTIKRSGAKTVKPATSVKKPAQVGITTKDISNKTVYQHKIIQNILSNMVFVEGGSFMMGKTPEQKDHVIEDRIPVHNVTLQSFYICKYEITQEEWQALMGNNPSEHKGKKRPVESVSWEECQSFIIKLNHITGKRFRLPTEAEWEYAARGGKYSKKAKYAGSNVCNDVAWNCTDTKGHKTSDVGKKLPNELGLYDMSGNVLEWCQDWYGEYPNESQTNPKGPLNGEDKVCRGGCWLYGEFQCLVSCRLKYWPKSHHQHLGFRIAL